MLQIIVGERIRQIREERGMSQVELAQALKTGQGYISQIEAGKKPIRLTTLEKICKALNCTIEIYPEPIDGAAAP